MLSNAESIEKSNNRLKQEVNRLEAEKRQLVRLLMWKEGGSTPSYGQNTDTSDSYLSSENMELFSVIDNLTDKTDI